jgi:hypothetical protein
MKRILGIILIAAPFVALFSFITWCTGSGWWEFIRFCITVVMISVVVFGSIVTGVVLLVNEKKGE